MEIECKYKKGVDVNENITFFFFPSRLLHSNF